MKLINTLVGTTLLVAASTATAGWDMPFFGNGSNANNGAFGGNAITDTTGNGAHKGNGSADGEGEFSFAMSFKGRGTSKMDTASTSDWKGNAKGDMNSKADTATQSVTNSQTASFAPVAAPAAPVVAK